MVQEKIGEGVLGKLGGAVEYYNLVFLIDFRYLASRNVLSSFECPKLFLLGSAAPDFAKRKMPVGMCPNSCLRHYPGLPWI